MKASMKTLSAAALLLAVSALLSKVLGVVRDMSIAYVFGTGESSGIYALDAYFAAFKIPDLIYTFLVAGAMSAAFIPLYTGLKKKSQAEASAFASQVLHCLALVLIGGSLLMYLLAPTIIPWITPGFDLELQAQTVQLTRIMLLSPIFLGLSSVFQGIENAHKSFLGIALAPLLYNASLIGGALLFGKEYGVEALSWSVVLGSIFHFVVQIPGLLHTGFKYTPLFSFKGEALRSFFVLTLPRLLGIGFMQITTLVDTILASLLAVGSLSVYNYALNLQSLPQAVVAVSVSVAVFAALSEKDDDPKAFLDTLRRAMSTILFWALPAVVGLYLLRNEVVTVLLERGAFDEASTRQTAEMLGVFIWAALAQSLIPLLARAFYALKNTKTPVLISVVAGTLQIAFSSFLVLERGWPLWTLALSAILASTLNAGLLMKGLSKRLEVPLWALFEKKSFWILLHSGLMGLLLILLQQLSYPSLILELAIQLAAGAGLYLGLHRLTRTTPRSL